MKIEKGRKVKLKVDLALAGGQPLEKITVDYVQGSGTMLLGLEKALEGLAAGAKKKGTIEPREAFGNPAMHPVKTLPRSEFPADARLTVGERFVAKGANGMNVILHIEAQTTDTVTVRYIHPLADKEIAYDVEVLAVSNPAAPPPLPAAALKLEAE